MDTHTHTLTQIDKVILKNQQAGDAWFKKLVDNMVNAWDSKHEIVIFFISTTLSIRVNIGQNVTPCVMANTQAMQ